MSLFSIGHSNHSIEAFIALLKQRDIAALVDVRSQPYSRYNPQFRREALRESLALADIAYHFMGDRLGGKPVDKSLWLEDGRVDYEKVASSAGFKHGLEYLLALSEQQATAFLCAEADFKHCHRYWLITRTLLERDIAVQHITPTGALAQTDLADFFEAQPSLF
jgi:uncharacterized protein (DUF488 family)